MDVSTKVIITCNGKTDDPDIEEKIAWLLHKISSTSGADEGTCCLKSVEPWNSVRVTFNLPREAAVRLQELARNGDDGLINLGILSVQIGNGEQLDLNAIRELLQQEVAPPPHVLPPISQTTIATIETVSHHEIELPVEQKQLVTSKSFQAPLTLPAINYAQQSTKPPPRSMSSGTQLPSHMPISSTGFPLSPISSSAMKSSFLMSPALSIGNIPTGIPSLHLGNLNKMSTAAGNAGSGSFPTVYSIAMPMGGNQRPPIQTPVLQSLPNMPTPQAPPAGNFPWDFGAKPSRFLATRPPSGIAQWNQIPMFTGTPNLPTNLPGSIPSIGPIPSPSIITNSRQEAPPKPKPKKKRLKRPRKQPKEKIPAIPLPPPLMPAPKPPTAEGHIHQNPPDFSLPIAMNPISPNENEVSAMKEIIPNPNITSVSQTLHTRFPFNQAQVLQAGRSDVSMTSPLLVNLLQSDFPSNQFPLSSGEQMKGTGTGPVLTSHRMQPTANVSSMTHHHTGTVLPHQMIAASQFQAPRNQPPPPFHHSLQGTHRIPMHQQSLSGESIRPDSTPKSNENYQQHFYPQVPFPHGMPDDIPTSFNRFQMPHVNFPRGSPQHLVMPQSAPYTGITEQRMQIQHTQSNWTVLPPTMTTVPSMVPSDSAIPASVLKAGMRCITTQSPNLHARDQLPKSAFDEESALAGMTEAERDTFVAAAKIAQDSKPSVTGAEAQSSKSTLPRILSNLKPGKLPSVEGFPQRPQRKSPSNMFAIENLAVSDQQVNRSTKKFSLLSGKEKRVDRSSSAGVPHSFFPEVSAAPEGRKPSPLRPMQASDMPGEVSNHNVDISNVQTLPASAMTQSKPLTSFETKPVARYGQTSIPQNPYLSLPPVASSPGFTSPLPDQSQPFITTSGSTATMSEGWPVSAIATKAGDPFQFDSKHRGPGIDYHSKQTLQAAIPPKSGNYSYDWPFPNISPPTQNLSTEGLQFMARLAAVPTETEQKTQDTPHFMPLEGLKLGKEDKPHLKALLNEISPSADGQTVGPCAIKRLCSEDKTERKRRKSSPRPATDQSQTASQPHGKVDQPGGSLELPRVPTAAELSFNLQQARAHSLDLLKGGTGYTPLPKSAPSSPRAKGRPKSVECQPPYGIQQSDIFQGKHIGSSSPGSAMPGNILKTTGVSSKSSVKSKESKSRSKSPKASGNKMYKVDQPGFVPLQPVTTTASVPFAGVHEFHPPLGLNICGPTKPGQLSSQSRKTTPASEPKRPMSPNLPPYGPKPFPQQNQFPAEAKRNSPLSTRPASPFKSASALLSSFALSAGKVPEFPVTTPGAQSPISSPRYVTSPLHQVPPTTICGSDGMEAKGDLQCYSETLQKSVPETGENVLHFPSLGTESKTEMSSYSFEPVGMSDSTASTEEANQSHETEFSLTSQSDGSSLWRLPHTKKTERKDDVTLKMPPGESQVSADMSTSSNITTNQFTFQNISNEERKTEKLQYHSDEKTKQDSDCFKPDGRQKVDEDGSLASPICDSLSLSVCDLKTASKDPEDTEHIHTNTGGQSSHTSVIVVSSQKHNATTIGVKKLGTSSNKYSLATRKMVSVTGTIPNDTYQAFPTNILSTSQTAGNASKIQSMPVTRVTRVIPISSDTRIPGDDLPVSSLPQGLKTYQCLSEESLAIPVPSSKSHVLRSTETVISTSLSGCGTPCDVPRAPNVISSRHVLKDTGEVKSAPKMSLSSLQTLATAETSYEDHANTDKSELPSFEQPDRSNQSPSSAGGSFPVFPEVSLQHSHSAKSGFMRESSACSTDVTRPFQDSPDVPPFIPEKQGVSSSARKNVSPMSPVDVMVDSDTASSSKHVVDVPSRVGLTDEVPDKWKDLEESGTSHNLHLSDPHASVTHYRYKSLATADANASAAILCNTSVTDSNDGSSNKPISSSTMDGLNVKSSGERSPSTEMDEVQLPPTSKESQFQTMMPSGTQKIPQECQAFFSKNQKELRNETNLSYMDLKDGRTCQKGITEGENMIHCSMDQAHTSKYDEALIQEYDSEEEEMKDDISQSEKIEVISLGNEPLDQDFDLEQDEDTIAMQIKNRSLGHSSPGSDAAEDGDELQGDDQMPVTRKRSMRASGRDMYYGPIPTYKRRKPNQK